MENIRGAINPTIAYAINTFCDLKNIESYLNIFSGSATLLIEAGISNPKLKLIGFDSDGKRNAAAIKNIKAAGLLKSIQLETADIFSKLPSQQFDCIASDLPFGMQINETEDLPKLYEKFLEYCSKSLYQSGVLIAYTVQGDIFMEKISSSVFKIDETLELKISTTVSSRTYLHPKIFVCSFR
jgi:23S rRNA G2445 N2-methylase RlmL